MKKNLLWVLVGAVMVLTCGCDDIAKKIGASKQQPSITARATVQYFLNAMSSGDVETAMNYIYDPNGEMQKIKVDNKERAAAKLIFSNARIVREENIDNNNCMVYVNFTDPNTGETLEIPLTLSVQNGEWMIMNKPNL